MKPLGTTLTPEQDYNTNHCGLQEAHSQIRDCSRQFLDETLLKNTWNSFCMGNKECDFNLYENINFEDT